MKFTFRGAIRVDVFEDDGHGLLVAVEPRTVQRQMRDPLEVVGLANQLLLRAVVVHSSAETRAQSLFMHVNYK